ncbi:PepSY domain-containing protein [Acinetobacter sp. MB5]|uniref:PepSY domain-containing protein n=1 Tax=Acinetobacter sp. MB5 TaxID=2069438 RepID=UPI000DCF875E|nr:sulfite reductase flavoprotein subunit alpha [Acinetobacter sp. MB5]
MLKKTLFQIHWFFGITAGLILSLMGVSGAIFSYEAQITKLINPDSYTVQAETRAKLTPSELFQFFKQQQPNIEINSITIAESPTSSSVVNIAKQGERHGYDMMVNPYTAQVLPEVKGKAFFDFIEQFHRTLTAGEFGKQLTGASTLILIFFVLSGLYLRFPKKHSLKQWLAIKPQLKGRNFLWDLHAVVGTWVMVFYLMFACTGLFWSYDWWRAGMFKVMGVENTRMGGKGKPEGRPPQGAMPQRGEGHQRGAPQGKNPQNLPNRGPDSEQQGLTLPNPLVQQELTQAWTGFTTQVAREYSTVTFNIPQQADGRVKIAFVDAVPQNERARNSAEFNTQNNQLEKVDLYANKKLNQQIMSGMLPVHRGSFFGPVYQFFAMLAALAMPLFFVTGWMLYLKRRKQKRLTQAARGGLSAEQAALTEQTWLISYATQTGTAEQLAWATGKSLQQAGLGVVVKSVQQLTAQDLQQAQQALFIVSTYGTGSAPDLAVGFSKQLMQQPIDLAQLDYAVLALGSKEYPESFCHFGHAVDTWLTRQGAKPLFKLIEVDNANQKHIQQWYEELGEVTASDVQQVEIHKQFEMWTLSKRELLNSNSLGAPAFHLELQSTVNVTWLAGDIAEIQPQNSIERIEQFLKQQGISTESMTSQGLKIVDALRSKNLTREIIAYASLDELLEQLPELPLREYSIASIPEQQYLQLVVRQQSDVQGHLGLGSGWLTQYSDVGTEMALAIRNNPSFHLIEDDRPIICIGNGTGIAGLLSLLKQRVQQNRGRNWLIFGERQREHDYFYQNQLEAWQAEGMLQRLDLAFSRDQVEKQYVHHRLREQAEVLKSWIEDGAVLYVCGSIQGMASDVDQALQEILGAEQLQHLRDAGRYRRDVY